MKLINVAEQTQQLATKLNLINDIQQKTGFSCLISSFKDVGDCVISFDGDREHGFKTWEDVHKIIAALPPTKNAVLEFAGREPLQTFSPFTLDIQTFETENGGISSAKIRYQSDLGQIWIGFKPDFYGDKVTATRKDGKHRGFGNYNSYMVYSIGWRHVINYSGGTKTYYADCIENKELFEETILNKEQ
jgi:hypothetical protein